ncbi:MAG TPA: CpaF family protein [Candidatus Aveggerthella excrementigallinarum]|nr:CpaF family protein [Candidatus Aveggerthella excrementigallinarum]
MSGLRERAWAESETRATVSMLKARVQDEVSARVADMGEAPDEARVTALIGEALGAYLTASPELATLDGKELAREIADDFLRFGPLQSLLADDSVTEIAANGPWRIYVERKGRMEPEPSVRFDDEAHLRRIVDRIGTRVNRRCDDASPLMDARLPDGSRVNAVIPPLAVNGTALTIRKFAKDRMSALDLLAAETLSPAMLAFLAAAVSGRCSIVVAGGTGSGKTTLLNVLSAFIPAYERIVTVEDAAELQLKQDDLVSLESRPPNIEGKGEVTIHDLVKNALRMRPDRIVVGEVRDVEALEIINAMTTGHDGSLTTIHANDAQTALSRLETMLLKSSSGYDAATVRKMIAQAVDLVVVIGRMLDGTRKILSVNAIAGMEGPVISLEELFAFEQGPLLPGGRVSGAFAGAGFQPERVRNRIESWGVAYNPSWFFDRHEVGARPAKEGAAP